MTDKYPGATQNTIKATILTALTTLIFTARQHSLLCRALY